jgi:asparagine synthase (glutamine-hydrolysing)
MSGIAGYFQRTGAPVDPALLETMLAAIKHRGVDSRQTGLCKDAAVGVQVLFSTPEARFECVRYERFPGYWIAADVRLGNRDDLAAALGFPRAALPDLSDGELIVAAYCRWGEQSPDKLRGDFAFALYDEKADQMFCARDPTGVKPFIYHLSPDCLVFASEVGGVMPHPAVPRGFNRTRIAEFLVDYLEWSDCTATFFEGVLKLAPGTWMKVGRQSDTNGGYWSLDRVADTRFGSESEYCEAFRERFSIAVERRLRGAEHTGYMLSGGVDSSSIVSVAHRLLNSAGARMRFVYSGTPDSSVKCPEAPFIRAVAGALNLTPTVLPVAEDTCFRTHIAPILERTDDPFDWRMTDPRLSIYKAAAADGCKAVLDGVDGDVAASQPADLQAVFLETGSLGRTLRASLLAWRSCGGMTFGGLRHSAQTAAFMLGTIAIPDRMKPFLRVLRRGWSGADGRLVAEGLAATAGLDGRIFAYDAAARKVPESSREYHLRSLTSGSLAVANDRYDRISSSFGVEARHPFQDRDLLEFCVGLPLEWKVRNGWTKYVLRRSLKDLVPDVVRWRQDKSERLWRHYYLASRQARQEALRLLENPSAIGGL